MSVDVLKINWQCQL